MGEKLIRYRQYTSAAEQYERGVMGKKLIRYRQFTSVTFTFFCVFFIF